VIEEKRIRHVVGAVVEHAGPGRGRVAIALHVHAHDVIAAEHIDHEDVVEAVSVDVGHIDAH
jgi:hypothetical protein